MFDLVRDLRFAARRLLRTPGFTLATVVTLALGIGANTAIFTIAYGVVLKPLPFPEPDRLVGLWQTAPGVNITDLNASIADYLTYRKESRTLADVAIWYGSALTVTGTAEPERVDALTATFRLLPTIGVRPLLGRSFTEKDDHPSSPEVVMLGYEYWQRRFGGDPSVVGRRITVDGTPREIVGVLPQSFWFMDASHDLMEPLRFDPAKVHLAGYNFRAIGRLRPGVTLDQANADLARMIAIELRTFAPPDGMTIQMMEDARLGPRIHPLLDDVVGDIGKTLWIVMATIGMVLLIACANVANLLLVRAEGRAQELAVRAALGAGRGRVTRELLVESLVLSVLGGLVGIAFATGAVKLVLHMNPARLPRLDLISVDAVSAAFTLAISLAAGVTFGMIPVLKYGRVRVVDALRSGGRNASAGRERNFTRNALTIAQVALALVLLIGSGLMIRTYQSMRSVRPGFGDPQTLQTFRITVPETAARDDAALLSMQEDLVHRLAALPGVTAASLINGLPMTGYSSQDPVFAEDHAYAPNQIPPLRRFVRAAPDTFEVLGATLVAGREYTWADIHQKRDVVLIGNSFAREYWGAAAKAIGKRIRSNPNDPWSEVIGVVDDIHHDGVDQPAPATVYWPLRSSRSVTYMVRGSRAGAESYAREIREAVGAVSRGIPVTQVQTMQQVYDRSMARTAFTLTLLALSGGMALLLAVVGIYAVVSYAVSQRTREIGIRMALGAQHQALLLMFVRSALIWGSIGAAVGIAASIVLSRVMSTLLFQINPIDPVTYAVVVIGLLASAALASYLPARRVTRIDPSRALRAE